MKYFILKHIQTIGLVTLTFMSMVSCHRGNTTNIVTRTNNFYQQIQYSGRVIFSKDQKTIEKISNGGFVKFTRNNRSVEAEPDFAGKISYRFDGDSKTNQLDANQQQFLTDAVKTIIAQRSKSRRM